MEEQTSSGVGGDPSPAKAVESSSNTTQNILMDQDSPLSSSEKAKSKSTSKVTKLKNSSKKVAPKGKDNIFKRLSIASITKGSRAPKTKKVKEKSGKTAEGHDDDDDDEKLVIDFKREVVETPENDDKETPKNHNKKERPKNGDKETPKTHNKKERPKNGDKETPKTHKPSSAKKSASKEPKPSVAKKAASVGSSSPASERSDTPKLNKPRSSKVVVKSENGVLIPESKIQPFLYGWRREVVIRSQIDPTKKASADIYYFTPRGKKLRSMPEVIAYLRETNEPILSPENFTFLKEPIYTPPMELVRQAKVRGANIEKPTPKPAVKKKVSKPPPPQPPPPPILPHPPPDLPHPPPDLPSAPATALDTEPDVPMAEGNENSTPVPDPVPVLGKRGRKIKSLPPDFMSPDDVSRKKNTSAVKNISTPIKPSPLKLSETNAEALNNSSDKVVKKGGTKRKQPPKPLTLDPNDTSGSPPAKKMTILSPHQIKKEVLSASDSEKSPAPHRSTPENHVMGSQSPQKDDALDGGKARPKVCFTFGKLNKIPAVENNNNNVGLSDNNVEMKKSQVIPFKKRRVTNTEPIKVSQNDRMCSLTCPGRQAQLPMLSCHICLCLFHPECVGFLNGLPVTEDFKCQRCLYQPYLKTSEPKPPVLTISKPNSNQVNDGELDRLSNIASSDDDENFLRAPPDLVLDQEQLAKDPAANLTIDDITARPLTENDLANNNNQETKENGNVLPPLETVGESSETNGNEGGRPLDNNDKPPVLNSEKEEDNDPSLSNSKMENPPCLNSDPATAETSPLVSLAYMVSSSGNLPIQHKEGCLASINSTGVPLKMPLLNAQGPIPNQRLYPLKNLPGTSNNATTAESLLGGGVNNQKQPVNLLPNSAPIVVGTQVLFPITIDLPGIAKGTVIYTNNPILRFLLPSSSFLASFMASPSVSSQGTTASQPNATGSSANETLQNSSNVLSQFLPVAPPVQVINVKEHNLCDLALKIPMNDGHLFSTKVILKTSSEEPSEVLPTLTIENGAEVIPPSTNENVAEVVPSLTSENGAEASVDKESQPPTLEKSETKSSENISESDATVSENMHLDPPDIDTVVSIMALNEPSKPRNDNDKAEDAFKNNRDSEVTEPQVEVVMKPIEEENSTKEESTESANSLKDVSSEKELEEKEIKTIDKESETISTPVDEFADITGPVLSPSNPLFDDDEIYNLVDIESNNWWLSESENEDGGQNDEGEPEYRPTSPVVLSRVEHDGVSRVISTTLANRGAQVLGDKDSCARVAKYRRPDSYFRREQEHSYSMCDQNHIFKRKKVTTLNLPKNPFHVIQSSSETLTMILEYLNIPDLLNARLVCKTWKNLASQSHLWSTVKLKGVKILDWKLCTMALEQNSTSLLDLRGVIQRPDQWSDFLSNIYRLSKVQGIVFGEVPSTVISSVVNGLPDLMCLEAEEIVNNKEIVNMDPGVLAQLQQMNILRVRAPYGMQVPEDKLFGGLLLLGKLTNLTHLSLTSLRKLENDDVLFIDNLPNLQVLEIGQCRMWSEVAYHRLGRLRHLRRLRLEMGGGAFADRGLANALIQLPRLQDLTLLAYRITSSMAASIRRLRYLRQLTIWPDMSSEGAMVVYNTLQAVRNLKRLKSFSWGIIYQDDNSTRYSRKHGKGKYVENAEVDEWWSEELRNTPRAKGIKIPMLKAFSESTPPESDSRNSKDGVEEHSNAVPSIATTPGGSSIPGMEQGLIGVGHLRQKLQKSLPESEIYVYQVPESLLSRVYGSSFNVVSAVSRTSNVTSESSSSASATTLPNDCNNALPPR